LTVVSPPLNVIEPLLSTPVPPVRKMRAADLAGIVQGVAVFVERAPTGQVMMPALAVKKADGDDELVYRGRR